ncbi:ribonuclease H family protein, partial [Streptomyces sp. IBSBF 2390]|uniref:ribonuclease H family protein n=1 Tax=Streptomyces sp. IBSBF 2390 TaxID=2903533 RepID=UPI002FDC3E21
MRTKYDHAKYLGVIIDKTLTWKENAKERVRKATNAFYACRSTFGKSWGLSPKIISWIYKAIIRPILMYGAVVWWYSLKSGEIHELFIKIQRHVCIAITGASTSSDSLFTLLAIPYPAEFAKLSALQAALRLKALKQWVGKTYGHTNIENKFSINLNRVNLDVTILFASFVRNFKVSIPLREEWVNRTPLSAFDTVFFTDGSKTENGCGAGIFSASHRINLSIKLPNDSSIFQCEIFAIKRACDTIKALEIKDSSIAICVDSRAALMALESHTIRSPPKSQGTYRTNFSTEEPGYSVGIFRTKVK